MKTLILSRMKMPNVVFLTIDCLRYDKAYLLNDISSLSRMKFPAVTACSFTTPSICSMMTGLYPPIHGVRHLVGETLSSSILSLPRFLKLEGYNTYGVAGIAPLKSCGLEKHFDTYVSLDNPFSNRQKGYYSEELYEVPFTFNMREPWFLWIHNADAHEPWVSSYEDALTFIDEKTFLFFQKLSPDFIFVTADHGESLGERGITHKEGGKHGDTLFDEEIIIPFFANTELPFKNGSIVSAIDFPSIVLGVLGKDKAFNQGRYDSLAGERQWAYSETTHPRTHFGKNPIRAIRNQNFKYIETFGGEDLVEYDLRKDPLERTSARVVMEAGSFSFCPFQVTP